VANRLQSGKPPLRGRAASLGTPSTARVPRVAQPSDAGAIRRDGARPATGRRGRKSVEMTATKRISDVLFPRGFEVASPRRSLQSTQMPSSCIRRSMYSRRKKFYSFWYSSSSPKSGKMRAADGSRRRRDPPFPRGSASRLGGFSAAASSGKRDKYRWEVECVTDVPIRCILNR
jgi:hypothetical protein